MGAQRLAALGKPPPSSSPPSRPHRWFCHVDDDNYVNARALLKLLRAFPQTLDVYVGRPSLNRPIHASEPQPHNRTVRPSPASWGPGHQPGQPGPWGLGWGQAGAGLGMRRWVFWVSLCVRAGGFTSDLWNGETEIMPGRQRDCHMVGPWSRGSSGWSWSHRTRG